MLDDKEEWNEWYDGEAAYARALARYLDELDEREQRQLALKKAREHEAHAVAVAMADDGEEVGSNRWIEDQCAQTQRDWEQEQIVRAERNAQEEAFFAGTEWEDWTWQPHAVVDTRGID